MYALLTKCFLAFLWTARRSRGRYKREEERGQYSAILTDQAWPIISCKSVVFFSLERVRKNIYTSVLQSKSIKDLLYGQK